MLHQIRNKILLAEEIIKLLRVIFMV